MSSLLLDQYNYAVVIILMMTGLYVVFASRNLIKKLVGLSVFQTSVFLLYITIGKVSGGKPPIVESHGADHANSDTTLFASIGEVESVVQSSSEVLYSNPLPHVLILTAIVVGVATLAIGLSLVVRVREVYGTIEEDKIEEYDRIYYKEILERQ